MTRRIVTGIDDQGKSFIVEDGDVVVQRATAHAWANRSNEPCIIAFILIDAG